jgi:transcriptional regulator with XRE-family HTH domain
MKDSDKKVIERIFELLNQKGIKPSKMTEDLKFSSGLTSQWKSYLQKPSIDKIKLIAPYLGVTINYLLNGTEELSTTQIVAKRIKEIEQKEKAPDALGSLDPAELQLINMFRQLNEVGKESVMTQAEGAIMNAKYINKTAAEDAANEDLTLKESLA